MTASGVYNGKLLDESAVDCDADEDWLRSLEGYEEGKSQPLEITVPKQNCIRYLTARYDSKITADQLQMLALRPDSANSSTNSLGAVDGVVVIKWNIGGPEKGISGFNLVWSACGEDEEDVWIPASTNVYHIKPLTARKTYTARLEVFKGYECLAVYGPVHCQVPGPPEEPLIWCRSVTPFQIVVEWNEPRVYEPNKVKAYQIHLNDQSIGKLLPSSQRKAAIHCQPDSLYRVSLVALGSNQDFGDSERSNMLNLITPSSTGCETNVELTTDSCSPTNPRFGIDVWVKSRTNRSITICWRFDTNAGVQVYRRLVTWCSVLKPEKKEAELQKGDVSYTIMDCCPGTNHFILISGLDASGDVTIRSEQLIIQTSAPISTPEIQLSYNLPTGILIEWGLPACFGDAFIKNFLLKIDDSSNEITLGPECQWYVHTNCQPLVTRSFRLKAFSKKEGCNSEWSEPLLVTSPGCQTPQLSRANIKAANCIKVVWERPALCGGARVKSYKMYYLEEKQKLENVNVQSIRKHPSTVVRGPFKPYMETDKLKGANPVSFYWALLEVELLPNGCASVFSEPIRVRSAIPPESPSLDLEVLGVDERLELEFKVCEMLQQRDRFLSRAHQLHSSVVVKGIKLKELQIAKAMSSCIDLEHQLEYTLKKIEERTGSVSAVVRWKRPSDDGDAVATGYQMLLDDKQFGDPIPLNKLHANITIPITASRYMISMRTLSDHPVGNSAISNIEWLSGKEFTPFSLFCYFVTHERAEESERCIFQKSMKLETKRKENRASQVPMHRGLLTRAVPAPCCSVLDVMTGEFINLTFASSAKPTALLFWTNWCASSIKIMKFFTQMAENFSNEYTFATCCVRSNEPIASHQESLTDFIKENGWAMHGKVQHLCACHSQARVRSARQRVHAGDVSQLYALVGVPTLLLFDVSGYICWQGRCACQNSIEFQTLLCHAFAEVLNQRCLVPGCTQCSMDEQEKEMLEPTVAEYKSMDRKGAIGYYKEKEEIQALHERLLGTRAKASAEEKMDVMDIKSDQSTTSSSERPMKKRPWNYLPIHPMDFIACFEEDDVTMYSTRLQSRREKRNRGPTSAQAQTSTSLPTCEPTSSIASARRRPGVLQQPVIRTVPKTKIKITLDNLKLV